MSSVTHIVGQALTRHAMQNVLRKAARKNARLSPRVGGSTATIEAVEGRRMMTAVVGEGGPIVVSEGRGAAVDQYAAATLRSVTNASPERRDTTRGESSGHSTVTFGSAPIA